MRAMPSLTSRTVPTSSTSRSWRSAASISRSRMSLISPGRSVVSVAIRDRWEAERRERTEVAGSLRRYGANAGASSGLRMQEVRKKREVAEACEKYHKDGPPCKTQVAKPRLADRAHSRELHGRLNISGTGFAPFQNAPQWIDAGGLQLFVHVAAHGRKHSGSQGLAGGRRPRR